MNELTPMQAACWFGRITDSDYLGGVAAHLYTEFDGQRIHPSNLESALQRVYLEHPILRLSLSLDGIAEIKTHSTHSLLEVDDLTHLSSEEQQKYLLHKREQWTHQQLDLSNGQTARFSVSLLGDNNFRLHIDTDMIAIDPSSFRRVMEDLTLFYLDSKAIFTPAPSFFEWHNTIRSNTDLKKLNSRDRKWWQSRLPYIAPTPSLPISNINSQQIKSHCLRAIIAPEELKHLQRLGRHNKVTLSNLLLGIFAFSLSKATNDKCFRLNIPTFWREPLLPETNRCVGDFANFVLLNVNITQHKNLSSLVRSIATQMIELLEHSHYPGVNVMRDLSRYHGTAQNAPIVFTAALDMAEGELFSESVHNTFGAMNWSVSQGPQVALDAQAVRLDGGLLINWDIRLDALPLDWVNTIFENFTKLLKKLCTTPELLNKSFDRLGAFTSNNNEPESKIAYNSLDSEAHTATPLSAIQKAYLLGRTTQLPLGGVAMQEFREYHGHFDATVLKKRLASMVQRHKSLRTYIDTNKLMQVVTDNVTINLKEIDLSQQSSQAATTYIENYRNIYSHSLFDLNFSPWNVTIFYLTDQLLTVFTRFDALILDGRSIAALMVELFETGPIEPPTPDKKQTLEPLNDHDSAQRKSDITYWTNKLSSIDTTPQIPWMVPLDTVGVSKFARKSVIINPIEYRQLIKIGAKQGLFKNSSIMSVVLELLAYWSENRSIHVAIPVLPMYSGALSNHSTFIALAWQANVNNVSSQAKKLQSDILEGLQHLSFSGVDLARTLFEKCGSGPVLPIVITNGLSWPSLSDAHPMHLKSGLTQTPQVAMDIRFTTQQDGALVFSIDYACDAIDVTAIDNLLTAIDTALSQIIHLNEFSFVAKQCFPQNQDFRNKNCNFYTNSASLSLQAQLFSIYTEVIGIAPKDAPPKETSFINMGLRPHHLKTILKRLNADFSTSLSANDVFQCRNIENVEKLLKATKVADKAADQKTQPVHSI
ncbi:peptide synthetase [Marinomonas rhizomae]|uniref:Condensation domain-containing protein n=1 Tax=Marinomonas rhizomae TaxID=491948 RepID=A0A366JFM7_9GAMM|nr:condensation domain-containing protein [Marinomonas rhizomae]RBP85786.1 condensation domain-containing protein [Marinomonas rhizomae]RNF75596.1 peptide synthetase [Marinomonas rhizomae]